MSFGLQDVNQVIMNKKTAINVSPALKVKELQ
jgi:hypothetical protein